MGKIGVFDSGAGGLTVLSELVKILPHEHFVYIADGAYCPYGIKTAAEISERVEKITEKLADLGAKAIVIACNTASVHIDSAKAAVNVPVVSVIPPVCEKAVSVTENKKVIVLATVATVNSGVYQRTLEREGITCFPLACSEFVEFIESGTHGEEECAALVEKKLGAVKECGADTLIHGCTHFQLLEKYMRAVLGGVNYLSCGAPAGERLKEILTVQNLLERSNSAGTVEIFTTGEPSATRKSFGWLKTRFPPAVHIEI